MSEREREREREREEEEGHWCKSSLHVCALTVCVPCLMLTVLHFCLYMFCSPEEERVSDISF